MTSFRNDPHRSRCVTELLDEGVGARYQRPSRLGGRGVHPIGGVGDYQRVSTWAAIALLSTVVSSTSAERSSTEPPSAERRSPSAAPLSAERASPSGERTSAESSSATSVSPPSAADGGAIDAVEAPNLQPNGDVERATDSATVEGTERGSEPAAELRADAGLGSRRRGPVEARHVPPVPRRLMIAAGGAGGNVGRVGLLGWGNVGCESPLLGPRNTAAG